MFTYFPPVCPVTSANNATAPAAQAQTVVSLPGCVHTAVTACCEPGPVHNTIAQPTHFASLPGCVHTAQTMCCDTAAPAAPQAQTVFPPLTLICGPGPVIPPAGAQAQFPTLSVECLKTATHVATAVLGCNAQAQAVAPAQAQTMLSAYPCPTVAQCAPTWNCGAAPAQAQAITFAGICGITTHALTAIAGCNGQAQAVTPAQGMVSAYPCPTVATCPPTWNCDAAPAQAQAITFAGICGITTHALTAIAGCNAQAQAVAPAQAMASAYPCPTVAQCAPTWNCGAAPAQAQAITFAGICGITTHALTAIAGCNAQAQAVAPAQAQFPTLSVSCLTATTTVLPTGPAITATVAATTAVANGAQAQAVAPAHHLLSAQPCPTVDQCAPTWNCGTAPAQAQFPTLSLGCATIVTTTL